MMLLKNQQNDKYLIFVFTNLLRWIMKEHKECYVIDKYLNIHLIVMQMGNLFSSIFSLEEIGWKCGGDFKNISWGTT